MNKLQAEICNVLGDCPAATESKVSTSCRIINSGNDHLVFSLTHDPLAGNDVVG
jgi:hypothetical protein